MNKSLVTNLAMLSGVLLIVAGVVAILVTGMDIIYGGLGVLVAVGGVALTLWGRRGSPETGIVQRGPERSTQKPLPTRSSHTKLDRKI
jgi:hypothetical protein